MDTTFLTWGIFTCAIIFLIIIDLGLFNKNDHLISFRNSILLSIFYISLACIFGIYIYYSLGSQSSREYFTGFILEKMMSIDNIFVISMIFSFFKIPLKYQHRVLFYGILGVIILRALMIFTGAFLIEKFEWILPIFGIILIITGIKTLVFSSNIHNSFRKNTFEIKDMYIYKLLIKKLNIHHKLEGNKFFITKNSKLLATPLFMALITIEMMDIIFAIDSIPAIFAVTQNTYIVYTSNIFAILGIRALFFLLTNIIESFQYIKYSLSVILILIGTKIFVAYYIDIPHYITLLAIIILLLAGIIASFLFKPNS